jgi:hypothetical protein
VTALRIAALIVTAAAALGGAKKPKPPTQPDINVKCVLVSDIRSTGLHSVHQISALVLNACRGTVIVALTFGYFDDRGEQFGDDSESLTLAAGVQRHIVHLGPENRWGGPLWKIGRIINMDAYSANLIDPLR